MRRLFSLFAKKPAVDTREIDLQNAYNAGFQAGRTAEQERCVSIVESRAVFHNGPHIITLEMNQLARVLQGEYTFYPGKTSPKIR